MGRRSDRVIRSRKRYGCGELFGQAVATLDAAELQRLSSAPNRNMPCPFKPGGAACHKKGGICSLALFEQDPSGTVRITGSPVTTCPSRFLEAGRIFSWVGEALLGTANPRVIAEVPFLMSGGGVQGATEDEVGRIDNVLVHIEGERLEWCALEMQAVYFSGAKFEDDLARMRSWAGPGIPMPLKQRRPDFRSSGPKRLMPQLQIKVPTLRRWGKRWLSSSTRPSGTHWG